MAPPPPPPPFLGLRRIHNYVRPEKLKRKHVNINKIMRGGIMLCLNVIKPTILVLLMPVESCILRSGLRINPVYYSKS